MSLIIREATYTVLVVTCYQIFPSGISVHEEISWPVMYKRPARLFFGIFFFLAILVDRAYGPKKYSVNGHLSK